MTVPETARDRNRRLYGRPRVPRAHKRIMVALLAADGLSGYPLSQLAQAGPGAVCVVLARLERLGWADRERHEGSAEHLRFGYTLTSKGRACVTILLGLPAEAARLTPEANDA
jgi:DNA-binding MarR family transcriptional regulator